MVVIDVEAARVRSVTRFDTGVCAFEDPLRWHPDGTRLAVNVDTNRIVVLDRGRPVLEATPDEGRDHGFDMVWHGDRLLVDLGGYLAAGGLDPIDGALPMFRMVLNPDAKAVVGFDGRRLRSYEPSTGRIRYDIGLGDDTSSYVCGPRGRRCAVMLSEPRSQSGRRLQPRNRLRLFDGEDGKVVAEVEGSLPQLGSVAWAPDGRLAVRSYDYRRLGRRWGVAADHVDVVAGDRIAATVDLEADRMIRGLGSPSEGRRMAFTRDGRFLAILVEGGGVVVADPSSGRVLRRFSAAPAPVPAWMRTHARWERYRGEAMQAGGLVASEDRWVRLYEHGLSVWSLVGERVGQWTAER